MSMSKKKNENISNKPSFVKYYSESFLLPFNGTCMSQTKVPCEVLMEEGLFPDGYGRWKKIATTHVNPSQSLVEQANLPCCTFNALSDDLMYKNL